MNTVEIFQAKSTWSAEYAEIASRLSALLGHSVVAIDHIGSTSVPGLAAKDVIDVQVSVAGDGDSLTACHLLTQAGYRVNPDGQDHPVPGEDQDPDSWKKAHASEPVGERRCHVHIRVVGRPNQRYALLFRDYLRCHPDSAEAYARFKKMAAALLPHDSGRYAALKDPVCDLLYLDARRWASETARRP